MINASAIFLMSSLKFWSLLSSLKLVVTTEVGVHVKLVVTTEVCSYSCLSSTQEAGVSVRSLKVWFSSYSKLVFMSVIGYSKLVVN